jgi:hypothetical protein
MNDDKATGNAIFDEQGLERFEDATRDARRVRPTRTHHEPARDIPVFSETEVLVVGGGPAGTSAAVAAARVGAEVTLVERYNHLGGLSTGVLVIWIDRLSDWTGEQIIAGFARDVLERLPPSAVQGPPRADWGSKDIATAAYWAERTAAFKGTVTWSPTINPEALKSASLEMVLEQRVKPVFHAWACEPIVKDGSMCGVVFESKEGRQAIMAKVVIDTTGDADLLSRAGAPCESDSDERDIHACINTAFMLAGVDMERWLAFKTGDKSGFSDLMSKGRERLTFFEKPFVSWRNDIALFMGPRLAGYSAVDVEDLTEVEIRSRRLTDGHLNFYRAHAPGFENAYLMLGAPQIGVRHSRRVVGVGKVSRSQWDAGTVWADEIGVSTSLSPAFPNISVPYGSLLPRELNGVLGAGRHIACDPSSHSFLREIPQCWMSGQAAGVAAALAAAGNVAPRDVDVHSIQRELLKLGAYLSPATVAGLASRAAGQAAE